jgi:hypothetical protein
MLNALANRSELQTTCKSQDQTRATTGGDRLDRFPASEIKAAAQLQLVSPKVSQIERSGKPNRSLPNLKVESGGKPVFVRYATRRVGQSIAHGRLG